jgi:hypothetical protein
MAQEQPPKHGLKARFRDVDFGAASAGTEASHRPDLLVGGFIDHLGMVEEAKEGVKFLFLGYKGSGKSALAEHLVLTNQNTSESGTFVRLVNIADLSFKSFSQIMRDGMEAEARYPTVWSWLLLLQLFDSFSRDFGSNVNSDTELWCVAEALRETGLLPDPTLSKSVERTLESNFAVKIPGLSFERKKQDKPNRELPAFVESLKINACRFRSENKHLLIIDGFDDLIRNKNLQYDALGALIFEAARLNNELTKAGTKAKIVVLCRTDLFDRLPGPNNNKILQDYAFRLDWSAVQDPRGTALIKLVNQRASLSLGESLDVFDTFLPPALSAYDDEDVRRQVLAHTRRTPRDIVMLFKNLQAVSGSERMTISQAFDGLAAYSREYFLREVKDEIDGPVERGDIDRAFGLFTNVQKKITTVKELEAVAKRLHYPSSFDLRNILRLLFECSAIGNLRTPQTPHRSARFRFKDQYAVFDPLQPTVFHRGLWYGLDLR